MKKFQVNTDLKTKLTDLSDTSFSPNLYVEGVALRSPYRNLIVKTITCMRSEIQIQNKNISIKICDCAESKKVNYKFCQKNRPTNVLAFPNDDKMFSLPNHLGDILICDELVLEEAKSLGIDFDERFSHMLVHGILHLKGFSHNDDVSANIMEKIESRIMSNLGYSDPYI